MKVMREERPDKMPALAATAAVLMLCTVISVAVLTNASVESIPGPYSDHSYLPDSYADTPKAAFAIAGMIAIIAALMGGRAVFGDLLKSKNWSQRS